jgi:hypothetical protein
MTLGWNPVPGSARNHDPIEPIEATIKKKNDPEGSLAVWMLGQNFGPSV